MRFVAIDVETANPDLSSICQIGLVVFENGIEIDAWSSLINPETWFHWANEDIHGINELTVVNAPTFSQVIPTLYNYLNQAFVISHNTFDRSSLSQAMNKLNQPAFTSDWIDTAKVTRRTWEQFSTRGYGLKNVAAFLGFSFEHHNALEDARAAAKIMQAALETTNTQLENWVDYSTISNSTTISSRSKFANYKNLVVKLDGNPEGNLFGEEVVFTGELSLPRPEIAKIAAQAGCTVKPDVRKKTTTLLVVGVQDPDRLKGKDRSSKQIKAEQLIGEGANIRILTESDFLALLNIV